MICKVDLQFQLCACILCIINEVEKSVSILCPLTSLKHVTTILRVTSDKLDMDNIIKKNCRSIKSHLKNKLVHFLCYNELFIKWTLFKYHKCMVKSSIYRGLRLTTWIKKSA